MNSAIKNLTGKKLKRFHRQRGSTLYQLAAELHRRSIPLMRKVIASTETDCCIFTDCQVAQSAALEKNCKIWMG